MAIIIRLSMTKSGQRSSAFIEDLTASVTWMKGETTLLSAVNVLVTRYGQASVTMMNLLEMLLYPTISQSQKRTAIATIFGRGEVMTGENECLFMSYQNSYANHDVLSAGQENTFKSRDFTYYIFQIGCRFPVLMGNFPPPLHA